MARQKPTLGRVIDRARHLRVCRPEVKPTRKRAVVPRRLKRREIARQLKENE